MTLVVAVPVVARLVIVVPKTVEVLQLLVDVGLSTFWSASGVWSCFQLIVQLLHEVVDVPVVVHVLMSVEVPQVQLSRRCSSSTGQLVDEVIDVPVCSRSGSRRVEDG